MIQPFKIKVPMMAYGVMTMTVQCLPRMNKQKANRVDVPEKQGTLWECDWNFAEAKRKNQTKSQIFFKYLSLISIKFQNQMQ